MLYHGRSTARFRRLEADPKQEIAILYHFKLPLCAYGKLNIAILVN